MSKLEYTIDWNCDGTVRMKNARTIDRYVELRGTQPNLSELGIFCAFTKEQYERGLASIEKREGKKVLCGPSGLFGYEESFDKLCDFYQTIDEKVKAECDPQEVYFYEYNNHECMINLEGDTPAIRVLLSYWEPAILESLTRLNDFETIDEIVENDSDR
jgi:hypothetical protein